MTAPVRRTRLLNLSIAAALALIALTSRLLFLFSSVDKKWPHSVLFEGDAPLWTDWIKAIHGGTPFEYGLPIHSPAVAHILSILGASPATTDWTSYKILWCVCSALTCPILYIAALRTLSGSLSAPRARSIAIIASLWFALSFHASALATSLNGETLYTLLLVSIIALGARPPAALPASIATTLALGILHGLATLVRAEHTLLMLMLIAWEVAKPVTLTSGVARGRRALLGALAIVCSILVCLPWSIAGTRATERMNTSAERLPDYATLRPSWTPDARAFMDTLPPFARLDNAAYLSSIALAAREPEINEARVRRYFEQEFGYIPAPLKTPIFVSSQGPLCFALANHPDSGGGFSRAAFDARFGPDPNLTFALPSHLKLYNEGYRAGLGYIREDPAAWLSLVGQKLLRFEGGITGGLGITNAPLGRALVRQPVDVAVVPWPDALYWRIPILILITAGAIRLLLARRGVEWTVILLAKLVVTIAFYGYARQSASILPALCVLAAAGLLWPIDRARPARLAMCAAACIAGAIVLASDIIEYRSPRIPTIEADHDKVRPARVNAQDGAFECYAPMTIEYLPPESSTP
ncbi:MAG: hypothetical protein KF902_05185 [Phycisphaeraceae bacterium]|nr:hypothetical protein [Phycisphaeraceae bacterium]